MAVAVAAPREGGDNQEVSRNNHTTNPRNNTDSGDQTQPLDRAEDDLPPIVCPPHIDHDAFAVLPRELQLEVANEAESVRNAVAGVPATSAGTEASSDGSGETAATSGASSSTIQQFSHSNYAADVLLALPESIRNEILQAEREGRERQDARSRSNSLAEENTAFLDSVDTRMRREILLQANSEFLADMPENIVQEARALQREAALMTSNARSEMTAQTARLQARARVAILQADLGGGRGASQRLFPAGDSVAVLRADPGDGHCCQDLRWENRSKSATRQRQ